MSRKIPFYFSPEELAVLQAALKEHICQTGNDAANMDHGIVDRHMYIAEEERAKRLLSKVERVYQSA